jgi:hypothetical protein
MNSNDLLTGKPGASRASRCVAVSHDWKAAELIYAGPWRSDEICAHCGARRWWPS